MPEDAQEFLFAYTLDRSAKQMGKKLLTHRGNGICPRSSESSKKCRRDPSNLEIKLGKTSPATLASPSSERLAEVMSKFNAQYRIRSNDSDIAGAKVPPFDFTS